MKRKLLVLLPMIMMSLLGFSQKSMEVGLFGGVSYYLGDLNPGKQFSQIGFSYGLVGRYNLDSRWAFRLNILQGTIKGDDEVSKANLDRMLKFESKITEFSAIMELNFLDYITGSTRQYVAPYVFVGVGVFWFNPKVDGVELKDMGTEGQNVAFDGRSPYKTFSFAMPFGIGFKYSLTKKLGFAVEWGMRKTLTDYIDDVSETYYLDGESINPNNSAQVLSDPTMKHKPGMMRGDKKTKDWYSFVGVTITYKFNLFKHYRCNDFGTRKKY